MPILLAAAVVLRVSAAVSLSEAMKTVAAAFERAQPGVKVELNLGASGELERQIREDAPVDVFVSAAEENMDRLERRGLVAKGTRRDVARNRLVLAGRQTPEMSAHEAALGASLAGGPPVVDDGGRPKGISAWERLVSLLESRTIERIAIGEPRSVPAGAYAMKLLDRASPAVHAKLVPLGNVRAVLDAVARGEADVGFVYATDLRVLPGLVEAAPIPRELAPDIRYPAASMTGSEVDSLAVKFLELLSGPAGRAALAAQGFLPP